MTIKLIDLYSGNKFTTKARMVILILLMMASAACSQPETRLAAETQALGTATNTPFALWTEFYVTVYRTPACDCPAPTHVPMYTLTPPAVVGFSYKTITVANIYNNTGNLIERWTVDRTFTTGDWIKNGRLYLGPSLPNRWIAVGDYVRVFP